MVAPVQAALMSSDLTHRQIKKTFYFWKRSLCKKNSVGGIKRGEGEICLNIKEGKRRIIRSQRD